MFKSKSSSTVIKPVLSESGPPPFETDPITLVRRQKQIDYGKNTVEYQNYLRQIPKETRKEFHPKSPVKERKCSRRSFDGEVRMWRLLLHAYNPEPGQDSAVTSDQDVTTFGEL